MKRAFAIFGFALILPFQPVQASNLQFTLHKLQSGKPGPTLLIIGGIQGDEPGGFTAASLLVTDYVIRSGAVWVVPNLNFESIIKRSRGVHGDMNRKFSAISDKDPEYQTIAKIKSIIKHHRVDLILNLHDGSGFYNPKYIDKNENPNRWGQCIVIDQASIDADRFGDMEALANRAIGNINTHTRSSKARFHLKNTYTSDGDEEMEKTLTYFAIRNGKPAMGVEASKKYPTHKRILQHLRFVESIMDEIGMKYSRGFELSESNVKNKLGKDILLALYDKKILFDFGTPRKKIRFVPMKKREPLKFTTNNPLVAIVDGNSSYRVRYGNRSVTILSPEYFDYDDSLTHVQLNVDGKRQSVPLGSIIDVYNYFSVDPLPGRRVNVIGYRHPDKRSETGITIKKNQIMSKFSVDKQARRYRVEFYKGERYSGMILVNFTRSKDFQASNERLPGAVTDARSQLF